MKTTISTFDVAEHLETDEDIQGFLKEVAATGDITDLVHALNTAARAKGMTDVAEKAGVHVPVCINHWQMMVIHT